MKKLIVEKDFGRDEVELVVSEYAAGGIAILLYKDDEEYARITVCLNDSSLKENEAYIDANNCRWAMKFITESRLGRPTGKFTPSGYCLYPLVAFDMERLREVAVRNEMDEDDSEKNR